MAMTDVQMARDREEPIHANQGEQRGHVIEAARYPSAHRDEPL